MLRSLSVCLALAIGAVSTTAIAAGDPIDVRKKIMRSNGGGAGVSGGMMKGEIAFDAKVATLAIRTLNAAAHSFGNYFPAGSETGMETRASPKIWEDMAGFEAKLAQFQKDTDAAAAAEPKDLDAFKAAIGPVLANCKSCHEAYQLPKN
ncbi:MAG: cytochrome c [Hyphomicrobiales bacterium]|nr:cytochrome c [Hyphomicrobiales bacterium]